MTTVTTRSTTTVPRSGHRRKTRTVGPAQPGAAERRPASAPPAPPAAPPTLPAAPPTVDWATYPGVRYALERLDARRRPAADGGPDAA